MRPLNLASRFLPHGPKAQHSQYVSLYLRQWRIARRILPLFHHEPCLCNLSRARTIDFGPQFFLDEYVCNQNYVINHIKNDYLESGSAGARRTERSRRDQGWARASPRAPASECSRTWIRPKTMRIVFPVVASCVKTNNLWLDRLTSLSLRAFRRYFENTNVPARNASARPTEGKLRIN